MIEKRKYINEIHEKLKSVENRENYKTSFNGFLKSLIIGIVTFLIFVLAESIWNFSSEIRTILISLFSLILVGSLIYFAILPLLRCFTLFNKIDYFQTAEKVGSKFPNIKDELKNSLQLLEQNKKYNSSIELVEKAFEVVYGKIKNVNFNSIVEFNSTKKISKVFGSLLLLFIIISFIPFINNSSNRLINYDTEFVIPAKFTFSIIPGDSKITKGENFDIQINIVGEKPSSVFLKTKSIEESEFSNIEIFPDSNGSFITKLKNVRNSFQYFAESENIKSNSYNVDVINKPVISGLELEIISPRYSRIPKVVQKDNGNISTLPGSSVNIKINSSKQLKSATINFSDKKNKELAITGTNAESKFSISESKKYYISIIDKDENQNDNPVTYEITTLIDEFPNINILFPNADIKLNDQNQISLQSLISDDYGFSNFVLNYKLSESRYETPWEKYSQIEIPINKKNIEEEVFYNWNLSPLNLAVEDVVEYYLEIFDNDSYSGYKSVKSKLFYIRVPSLDEMFDEAEDTQEFATQELEETLEEAKKLSEEFEKISDELKQDNKELSFEEKERIKNTLERFEELSNKVEDVQKKLDEMQKNLQENNLLSEETLEKYMELQELMDELSGEEFREALAKMQEMMEQMQRDQLQDQFDETKLNEENFKKSIERTLNLLKRLQVEQKIDEMIKRSEELTEKQNDLNKKTEENSENSDKNLGEKQDEISKDLEKFEKELNKLKEKMSELSDMPQEQMEKTQKEFEDQKNKELSEEAKKNLEKNDKQQAMKQQQQLSKNMQNMQNQMENLQNTMQQQNKMQVLQDMMKIIDNILSLSKEQEQLSDDIQGLSPNSPQLNEKAQKQNELKNNLSKVLQQMSKVAQKTFGITPEMAKAIGKAVSEMNSSISSMQNGNTPGARQSQNAAMGNLNEAASMMGDMMKGMMSGGSGSGGMMSLMQQMQKMSQQQMNLNQLTKMMNQGSMTKEQMGQLQRLSQEQELIRKSLEQLNKESKSSGNSKKIPANLEKILQDMKEVVSDMQTQKLGDDLIQKQERILSKLLDAQRSINERDFEKERESFAGKNFNRESPPELNFDSEDSKNQLRDELLKAIKEGYLKDYQDLIRKYFETLQKEMN